MSDIIDINERIRVHHRRKAVKFLLIILLLIAVIGLTIRYVLTKKYTDYMVISTVDKDVGDNTTTVRFKDGFLKYDNDGIAYYDPNNKVLWQYSYEIRKPIVSVCEGYVAVSGIDTRQILMFDEKGLVITIDTVLTVNEIDVSSVGTVTAVLEDNDICYVRMFDSSAKIVYDLRKVTSGDGYPMSVAVSKDGKRLAISLAYTDHNKMNGKIMFYNFSKIGQNEIDNFVGEFVNEEIVMEMEFVTNKKLVAIGSDKAWTYEYDQYPKLLKSIDIKDKIHMVKVENGSIAMVLDKDDKKSLVVYNLNFKELLRYDFDREYTDISVFKSGVMMYNSAHARMVDYYGIVRFDYDFDIPLNSILWMSGKDRFAFVNVRSIQQVKLR